MKGRILFPALIMFLTGFLPLGPAAHADNGGAARVAFGPQAGVGLTRFTATHYLGETTSKKSRPALRAGAFVEYPAQRRFSLMLRVLFDRKEMEYRDSPLGEAVETVDYLSVPLAVKMELSPGRALGPYVFAGPQLGIRLRANEDLKYYDPPWTYHVNVGDGVRRTALGIDCGLGLAFSANRLLGFVEAGYDYGMSNIDRRDPGKRTVKTRGVHFDIGVNSIKSRRSNERSE